jgi:hypothetical protein
MLHLDRVPARNTQPWHAMGELLMTRVLACAGATGTPMHFMGQMPDSADPLTELEDLVQSCQLAYRLQGAQPYLWSQECLRTARHSPPLPSHVISRNILPYPILFFSREVALPLVNPDGSCIGYQDWMVVTDEGEGIGVWTSVNPHHEAGSLRDGEMPACARGMVRYGARWPDDFSDVERLATEAVLKELAFINSPFVDARPARLERMYRRMQEREGVEQKEVERPVAVVVLRRAENLGDRPKDQPEGECREWKHHWWVSGHFRAQWVPTEQAHKVIWIAPYIKGDLSKPLLEKVYSVAR